MPLTESYRGPSPTPPRFYTVGETAAMLRTSAITVYRAINDGEFPAVRLRGRLIVPARVIDDLVEAALNTGALIDTATHLSDATRVAKGAAHAAGGAR